MAERETCEKTTENLTSLYFRRACDSRHYRNSRFVTPSGELTHRFSVLHGIFHRTVDEDTEQTYPVNSYHGRQRLERPASNMGSTPPFASERSCYWSWASWSGSCFEARGLIHDGNAPDAVNDGNTIVDRQIQGLPICYVLNYWLPEALKM